MIRRPYNRSARGVHLSGCVRIDCTLKLQLKVIGWSQAILITWLIYLLLL